MRVRSTLLALSLGLSSGQVFADVSDDLRRSMETSQAAPGEAPAVAIYGDSTGVGLAVGLALRDDTHADLRMVKGWAGLGCSITSPATVREHTGETMTPPACADWLQSWRLAAAKAHADVAVVLFGPWEVHELKPRGLDEFFVIGSPPLDTVIERNLAEGVEALLKESKIVVLSTSPYIQKGRTTPPLPESDPVRMDRLNAIIRRVASRYDRVALIDLAGFVNGRSDDTRLRPDGVHYTVETAREMADVLAPVLVALAASGEPASPDPALPIRVLKWPRQGP